MVRGYVLAGLALIAVTAALYAPSLSYPFVYEDRQQPPVQWRGARVELADFQLLHPARFVSNLSYRLTHAISPLPWADHLGNVVVHLVNTGLLLLATWPVFGWLALVSGAVFALHPLQAEAVTYISSRPDLLVGTGILLALVGVTYRRYGLLLVGLAVAALSKETGVMAAPLALFWAWRIDRPLPIGWLIGLGVLAGVLVLGHYMEFARVWLGSVREISDHLAMLWRLLLLVVWPVGFSIDHDWSWITPLASLTAWLGWMLLLHLYTTDHEHSWIGFALVFALLAVAPRLLLHDPEPIHEHHMVGPMIGISLAIGGAFA